MSDSNGWKFNRRGVLKSSMAVLGGGLLSRYSLEKAAAEQAPAVKNVNLNSNPSTLKITDMRYAIIVKPGPSPCPIIRIDTNQGVYGLGEVRDVAGYQYAMVLKSRLVGENPLKIDYLFQKIQQFGGVSRQAGGVCAVEMALWDIAGKVYNIPVYQMLGGQWRDKVRIYADTTESDDPKEYGRRAKERKAMGITWMKMDLGINGLEGMPLSMDHLGHVGVKSAIKLGKAYEKYNLEWIEDVIPWFYTDLLKEITDASPTPTITGEDIYEIADFEKL